MLISNGLCELLYFFSLPPQQKLSSLKKSIRICSFNVLCFFLTSDLLWSYEEWLSSPGTRGRRKRDISIARTERRSYKW